MPIRKLVSHLIITLALGFSPQLIQAQTTPVLSLSPASQTVNPSASISLELNLADVNDLGSFQVTLSYDPNIITYNSLSHTSFLSSTGRTLIPLPPVVNSQLGTLTFGAVTFGQNPGVSGTGTLSTINFTSQNPGTSAVSLSNLIVTDSLSNSLTVNSNPASIVVSPGLTPSPSPAPTLPPPSTGSASLRLDGPTEGLVDVPVSYDLILTTTESLSGVDVLLNFDPRRFTLDRLENHHLLPNTPIIDFNNGSGLIRLSQVIDPGSPATASGRLITLHGTPKTTGPITFHFQYLSQSKADSNAISFLTGQDVLLPPSDFSLEILNPADLILTLTTPSESSVSGHQVVGILTATGSTLSASLVTNRSGTSDPYRLPSDFVNQIKTFSFKVSGFLRKAFTHTINPGINSINLGLLIAGDLNNDGQINTLDLSLMYDSWGSTGLPDYNQDGIVNSADHWHLITNFLQEDL